MQRETLSGDAADARGIACRIETSSYVEAG